MTAMKMDGGGSGSGKLSGPVEYACTRRLRHRLVLSYLSQQGLQPTFQSMVQQTDAHLCLKHLQQLVARGLLNEAVCYICRFLPSGTCKAIEDRPLLLFLYALWTFANIAASASHAAVAPDMHRNDLALFLTVCRNLKLCTIVIRLLKLPQFRASLNWGVISNKASFIACDLARESPELSHWVVLPSDPASLHDVLPICPRQKSYVKGPPRRPPARTITKLYLNKRRSVSSSSLQPGFATNSLNQVADLIMKCFNIGESLEFLQSSKKEDAPGAPLSQTMFDTLTDPAKTIGTSSVKNAGAPVSLPAKTSGILSGTYAGTTDTIQDVILRKNPRTELSTVREDPDPKRQRICVKLVSVHRPEAEVHRMNLMA
ncbi:hypothetical protein BRADI_4g21526v3 [Brachypodium distachyon]|uniref:LisH domain-containing protein n=2 Tax=Brachypodium distachyon TaxID=15368 RepID=A0A0Q3PHK1_BRADI|nr:hypothetical protein BRADI_4g21526v3 [Brachypodium distachyon]